MNRLVLIGNGFDLAHGLKTSYADFINWYIEKRYDQLLETHNDISEEPLLTIKYQWHKAISIYLSNAARFNLTFGKLSKRQRMDWIMGNDDEFETTPSPLFERIMQGINDKYWSGIERDYYDLLKQYALEKKDAKKVEELNSQLHYLQERLIEYLTCEEEKGITKNQHICDEIYAPINAADISTTAKKYWTTHLANGYNSNRSMLQIKMERYNISSRKYINEVNKYKEVTHRFNPDSNECPELWRLPERIMLVNFNYTSTPEVYLNNNNVAELVYIHGKLNNPESVIFGYGDERDSSYRKLQDLNYHECMRNLKSMRYPQTPSYKKVLEFIEAAPFQVYVMGHSCGLSDRTLLSKIFRHKLCSSIKPYFYVNPQTMTDNYDVLMPNISRHLDKMADRVVSRDQCSTLEGN